ncbi:hypothetical protein PIROE2DRAFT_3695 [Piromyces sp. E2]|nr:hypothetical protein PIROE2DRAFT_3695 [Piromyces sp. E2]|eukprot:OUM68557.1 hypothetical protein PIROE2DRAFT_3695 [Piromyces sp. E2]
MDGNTFIPYNAKLSQEEIKALFSNNDNKAYNIISIDDYNTILKSFNEKNEKEAEFKKKAEEKEKIRLKGLKLTERIKSKSEGHTSVFERIKERELQKEREKQRIDEEWRKLLYKEKEETLRKIKEKKFFARSDVIEFNKKIQESNMLYERQLQIELKRKRKEIRDKLDKEFEQKQVHELNNNIYVQKIEDNMKKLKEIDAGKQIEEQIIQNKELKKKMKEEEEKEIMNSEGLLFDPEKTEEEKRENLRKLYEDIDKQIQQKQKLKKQQQEKEEQFDREILEYNNNKSYIQEKLKNAKMNEIK